MTRFDDTVHDALTTVRLVPRWTLAPQQWAAVTDALRAMEAAIAAIDALALHRASLRLEANGPTRLSAIPRSTEGTTSPGPPQQVLDLINTLVHPQGGWVVAPSTPAGRPLTDTDSG